MMNVFSTHNIKQITQQKSTWTRTDGTKYDVICFRVYDYDGKMSEINVFGDDNTPLQIKKLKATKHKSEL